MPVFPQPTFPYSYDVATQVALLRAHKQVPDRLIPAKGPSRLLLATWNIANFGAQDRRDTDFQIIAEVISWFDAVAVQEVRENFSHLEQVHQHLPAPYRLLFTDIAGNMERMTYVYDSSKLTLLEKIGEISIPPSDLTNIKLPGITQVFRGFDRNPYLATFRVAGVDFLFVNVHLYFGSDAAADMQRRSLETFAVARWADLRRKSPFAFTKEIVALGDFNMPKAAPGDPIYDALVARGLELPDHSTTIASSIVNDAQYRRGRVLPRRHGDALHGEQGRLRLRQGDLSGSLAAARPGGLQRLSPVLHVRPPADVGRVRRHVTSRSRRAAAASTSQTTSPSGGPTACAGRPASGSSSTRASAGALSSPATRNATCRAALITGSVIVSRTVASLGTALATTRRSRSRRAALPGNSDAV